MIENTDDSAAEGDNPGASTPASPGATQVTCKPTTIAEIRAVLVGAAQAFAVIPVWYEWDGKHWPPPAGHYGLDCSGTACLALEAAGLIPVGHRIPAHALADACYPVSAEDAQPGDFVFYRHKSGPVTHVMMVLDAEHVIGAQGGGSATTTIEIAKHSDARVKIRERATYRPLDVVAHGRWRGLPAA